MFSLSEERWQIRDIKKNIYDNKHSRDYEILFPLMLRDKSGMYSEFKKANWNLMKEMLLHMSHN